MATNQNRWIGSLGSDTGPLIMLGKFDTGDNQAIKRGEILELTGNTNTTWVPIDSDADFDSNLAIANEEIKAGDRGGYYEIIVPRPGDIFEYDLATAANSAVGTAWYYSSSEALGSSGSYALGHIATQAHYPLKQGHLADDASGDAGTTLKTTSSVGVTFNAARSYYSAIAE